MNTMMNNFNRGFGGQPQPQRPGGNRRNNRNFRGGGVSRFDASSRMNQNSQNNQSRNEPKKEEVKPTQGTPSQQNAVKNEPATPQAIAKRGSSPQANKTPQQQQQQKPPPQNQQPQQNQQQQQQPPQNQQQPQPNPPKPFNQTPENKQIQTANQPNFGGNKQQSASFNDLSRQNSFNDGNRHSGNFKDGNRQGGNFGNNFNDGNRQSGNFNDSNRQGGKFGQQNRGGPGGRQGGQQGGPPGSQGGQQRNQRGGRGPQDGNKPGGPPREEILLANKLKDLAGPLVDLPPLEQTEVKFNGRNRLYVGNLSNETTETEIQEWFKAYGETSELFHNKEKNFAFIRVDYRANAEKAKRELDGSLRHGKPLRVRFAPHNSAIRVKSLTQWVTNELLYKAFEIFGKIERAYVRVDERGKSLCEGVVEYVRKPSALAAIRNCTEKCFFLTASLRPVVVESFEEPDELDGYPEKNLPKKNQDFLKSREVGPRFAEPSSFEHEYGTRWKQMYEMYKQKEEALKNERVAEEEKLEAQMEFAKYEHETELLREQLRQREQDRERQKRSWEMAERAAEERREQERANMLRHEEDLTQRMRHQDDELRRRQQENTLFVQAQRLNSLLDRQEQGIFNSGSQEQPMDGGFGRTGNDYEVGRGFGEMMQQTPRWDMTRSEDFPNKRRRF